MKKNILLFGLASFFLISLYACGGGEVNEDQKEEEHKEQMQEIEENILDNIDKEEQESETSSLDENVKGVEVETIPGN